MLGIVWIVIGIIFSASSSLMSRVVLKSVTAFSFTLLINLIAAIMFLPFAISKIGLPDEKWTWLLLIFGCSFWALTALFSATSNKKTEASVRAPLLQSRLLWALLMGIIILNEKVTINRALGVIIIFLGMFLLLWHPERKFGSIKDLGIQHTFAYAFLSASTAVIDKSVLRYFPSEFYGFLAFFIPTLILTGFIREKKNDIAHLWKNHARDIIIISFLTMGSYYAILKAYIVFDISFVYPLLQISVLLTTLGGIIFLKEREHLWQKIIAALVVITGSIVLKLG